MKKTIAILLVALMALTMFAACKKDKKNADGDTIVGTWELDFNAAMSLLSEQERAMMEQFGITADNYKGSYTFKEDGTGHAEMTMMGESMSGDFTYKTEGDKLTITATMDGQTSTTEGTYTIEGNKLTMTSSTGETLVFNRK